MIAVIDYGMGNLKSVTNALEKLGVTAAVTRDKKVIDASSAIILPGVGAFGKCIENLEQFGLLSFIKEKIGEGKRYLGICLGMQVLFESSEEAPGIAGIGVIKGTVPRFSGDIKVPHMGWNSIDIVRKSAILQGIKEGEFFYFVHSYYCEPTSSDVIATKTPYGGKDFVSAVEQGNLFACQFHPEKSQRVGLKLLRNFVDLASQD